MGSVDFIQFFVVLTTLCGCMVVDQFPAPSLS